MSASKGSRAVKKKVTGGDKYISAAVTNGKRNEVRKWVMPLSRQISVPGRGSSKDESSEAGMCSVFA